MLSGRCVHSRLHSSSLHQRHIPLVLPEAFLSVTSFLLPACAQSASPLRITLTVSEVCLLEKQFSCSFGALSR